VKLPVLVATVSLFVVPIFNVAAGPAVTTGPAQPDTGGAVYGTASVQTASGLSPGVAANNNLAAAPAGNTTQSAGPATTSSSSGASANDQNRGSGQNVGESSARGGSVNAPSVTELKQEKVVELSEKDLAAERAKNQNKSEVTKKFESSLLDQGIEKIAKPEKGAGKSPVTDHSDGSK
jgi:hypothetical protein